MQYADRIPPKAEVLEIGAGEGRTLRGLAQSRGVSGVGVDFSHEAIATGRRRAAAQSLDVTFEHADIRSWSPSSTWDVVIVTFVQLLPPERSKLYAGMRAAVRPDGLVLGQWFRPDHLSGDFDRVGPNRPDRMVPPDEVEAAFKTFHDLSVTSEVVSLDEGRLQGEAATVHLVARFPA
ncbi:class I SAM-dependent methyltransferase [Longibacter sp.]|uniref:class I SAM-dependent methyltransferase n=1 Tax=Longibacter sp. TaxID=2045415 RepID=UPI003EBDB4C7